MRSQLSLWPKDDEQPEPHAGPTHYHNEKLTSEERDALFQYLTDSDLDDLRRKRAFDIDQLRVCEELDRRSTEGEEEPTTRAALSRTIGYNDVRLSSAFAPSTRIKRRRHHYKILLLALRYLGMKPTPPLSFGIIEEGRDESSDAHLTRTQRHALALLREAGKDFTANSAAQAWKSGQTYYLDNRLGVTPDVRRIVNEANDDAKRRVSKASY